MFFLACFNVWLKAPRLISALDRRNEAFSSFVNVFSETFVAKKSIEIVSSCVFVKLLFFASIFIIGSFAERVSHF